MNTDKPTTGVFPKMGQHDSDTKQKPLSLRAQNLMRERNELVDAQHTHLLDQKKALIESIAAINKDLADTGYNFPLTPRTMTFGEWQAMINEDGMVCVSRTAMDLLRTANRNMEKKLRAASNVISKKTARIKKKYSLNDHLKKEKAKNKKK